MSSIYSRMARGPLRKTFSVTRLSRPARSSFSNSHGASLNESNNGHEDLADHYEERKQDQLRKQKDGRNEWEKELGSNSEQAVKADRGEVKASNDHIKKMQEETARSAEAERK